MGEWFEEASFWQAFEHITFSPERIEQAETEVEQIIALTGISKGRVLDLCCGVGRHSICLAKRNLEVTGVDITASYIRTAKDRAKSASVEVEFVVDDMRNFQRPQNFDLVLSLFTSFGYLKTVEDDIHVLENMYVNLKEGGKLVIETINKNWLKEHFEPVTEEKLPDGTLYICKREALDDWKRIRNEWRLIKLGSTFSSEFEHNIYSGTEYEQMFLKVGFSSHSVYGNLGGNLPTKNDKRLVIVGVK